MQWTENPDNWDEEAWKEFKKHVEGGGTVPKETLMPLLEQMLVFRARLKRIENAALELKWDKEEAERTGGVMVTDDQRRALGRAIAWNSKRIPNSKDW